MTEIYTKRPIDTLYPKNDEFVDKKTEASHSFQKDSISSANDDPYMFDLRATFTNPAPQVRTPTDSGCTQTDSGCFQTQSGCSQTDSGCSQTQNGC